MTTVRTVRTLMRSPGLWIDVIRTVTVAAGVELGLRTLRVRRLARLLGVRLMLDGRPGRVEDVSCLSLSARERQRLDVAWRVLRQPPFNGTCLRQALVGAWILRKRDHAVRIGVRKVGGTVAAHAWIELDGVSLDPTAIDTFSILAPVGTLR